MATMGLPPESRSKQVLMKSLECVFLQTNKVASFGLYNVQKMASTITEVCIALHCKEMSISAGCGHIP